MSTPSPLPATPTASRRPRGIYAISPSHHKSSFSFSSPLPSPSTIMAVETADPDARASQHLPPKSYAAAAEEGVDHAAEADYDDESVDEAAIKESPPRKQPVRGNSSEPRALGEVMDEDEKSQSPPLRHPVGRIEELESGARGTYADAVKEPEPAPAWPLSNGVEKGNDDGNGAPLSFSGMGSDETPRSPGRERRPHKRVSSKSLNGNGNTSRMRGAATDGAADGQQTPQKRTGDSSPGSDIITESYRSKSGHNLASIEVDHSLFDTSLAQRENKDVTTEPSARPLPRRDSTLVSGRRAGAGWSQSAIRWAPLNIPLQRRLQTLLVLAHTLSIAGGLALFFLLCTIPLLWPLLVPYLLYVLLSPAATNGSLAHRSNWLRSLRLWSLFASYFPARLHRSVPLEPTRKYIFGYHPHGIISHGAFAAFATEALGFSQLFPGITNTLLTLDANFRIPLYRDYALRMGLASVSRESCEALLSRGGPNGEGMGRAITIVVGGARESLDAKPQTLKLVLKRRKGFVKLAIRNGADLVPTLAFGENDLYEQFDSQGHPYVHKFQMLVKRVMGFTVPLFHARGVFNYDVGMMPYRRPINIVVGRPINIHQQTTPSPEYVDEIHGKYVEELCRVWDEWKDTFARRREGELEVLE